MKTPVLVWEDRYRLFRNPKKQRDMKKLRIEIKVSKSEAAFASHVFNWDAVLRESFESKGDGVFHSTNEYQADCDREAAEYCKKATSNDLRKHGITAFFADIVEYED